MTTDGWTKARVVDLLQFKQERGQRRLDFADSASVKPTLALVRPFRHLTAPEVAHRQRMVEFLSRAKGIGQRA